MFVAGTPHRAMFSGSLVRTMAPRVETSAVSKPCSGNDSNDSKTEPAPQGHRPDGRAPAVASIGDGPAIRLEPSRRRDP